MDINSNQVTCEVIWQDQFVGKIAIDPVHG